MQSVVRSTSEPKIDCTFWTRRAWMQLLAVGYCLSYLSGSTTLWGRQSASSVWTEAWRCLNTSTLTQWRCQVGTGINSWAHLGGFCALPHWMWKNVIMFEHVCNVGLHLKCIALLFTFLNTPLHSHLLPREATQSAVLPMPWQVVCRSVCDVDSLKHCDHSLEFLENNFTAD